MSAPSRFRKSTRETADCKTASGQLVLYGKVLWGLVFDRVRSVINGTIAIATKTCRFKLEVPALELE